MKIYECPTCSEKIQIEFRDVGKVKTCPFCKNLFTTPPLEGYSRTEIYNKRYPVRSQTSRIHRIYDNRVVAFGDQAALHDCDIGDHLYLRFDFSNQYLANAVNIYHTKTNRNLGLIDPEDTPEIWHGTSIGLRYDVYLFNKWTGTTEHSMFLIGSSIQLFSFREDFTIGVEQEIVRRQRAGGYPQSSQALPPLLTRTFISYV